MIPYFSAILVDDEQAAHYSMQFLLKNYQSTIHVIEEAFSGKQAVELINRLKPDLVFLDIQMPDMSGFEVLSRLSYQPYVIFCTAFDQYAIDAFRENSIDYLLKPVDDKRFAQCMDKLQRLTAAQQNVDYAKLIALSREPQVRKATAIPIHTGDKIVLIRCEEIAYCVASEGYVSLMTDEGKEHVSNLSLSQLEERLPDHFMRVQRSYIVNKEKINEIHKYFNNRLILVMDDKKRTRITTGTSYIDSIRNGLNL